MDVINSNNVNFQYNTSQELIKFKSTSQNWCKISLQHRIRCQISLQYRRLYIKSPFYKNRCTYNNWKSNESKNCYAQSLEEDDTFFYRYHFKNETIINKYQSNDKKTVQFCPEKFKIGKQRSFSMSDVKTPRRSKRFRERGLNFEATKFKKN